eukprot:gb/GECH01012135.1/.p1 GENE.gb/GECH01012135.1/~~gb/GECH01012135.1/.p1  ORF type:complete len:118 (+),score=27.89 gb/GECH01012135.1/:1-354(+)
MVVRLRLARGGRRNLPFFKLVAADSRAKASGRYIEQLGVFWPIPRERGFKEVHMNFDRVKYWLSVGAQPSNRFRSLLAYTGMLPPLPAKVPKGWNPKLAKETYKAKTREFKAANSSS